MNKKFFFVCIASLMLAACSEKVDQADSTTIDSVSTITEQAELHHNDIETDSEEIDSTETSETTDELDMEEKVTDIAETETSIDEVVEEKVTEETIQTSLQTVDKDIDYYDYYEANSIVKNDETFHSETNASSLTQEDIVYEQLSDSVIQLPLLQDNRTYFQTDDVQKIALSKLEEIDSVKYYEEPLTRGYLIDINLSILKEHYLGKSYSFEYNENEYGVMISEETKEYGVILLRETEGLLEDIKQKGTFNILN